MHIDLNEFLIVIRKLVLETCTMEVFHDTATECHLPYGITQCYLLPNTSEHTPP